MVDIYDSIYNLLINKESLCLATILYKEGSAPREEGTKMIIKKDFSIIGTIGGGLFEALTIKLSKDIFEKKCSIVEYFNLSNKDSSSLGMVCGGELKVLVEYLDAEDEKIVEIYRNIWNLKEQSTDFALITKIEDTGVEIHDNEKWICTETSFYGSENDEIQLILKSVRENFKNLKTSIFKLGESKYLVEPVLNHETVYIFEAGHVSQKLAHVTKMVEFKTVVLDDRIEFANRQRFKDADEVKVIRDFNNILDDVKIDKQSYIVIVTRGHAFDKEVLSQALKTNAKYIGMIGSRTKTNYVYNKLMDEGYTQKDLDRVHAPIGLQIYADTPEEIAISIVSELIKVRRGHENDR